MLENKLHWVKTKLGRLNDTHGERIGDYASRGLNGVAGGVIGAIDVLSTGYPFLTIGVPVYDFISLIGSIGHLESIGIDPWMFADDKKKFAKEFVIGKLTYAVGAAIPFTIRYHQEIESYAQNLVERL